jgi:hypothetical protein
VETTIGVFASRADAESALRELLGQAVPQDAIIFLTGSASDASAVGKLLGTYVGGILTGAADASFGAGAATVLIPAIGRVFAMGYQAATLLNFVRSADQPHQAPQAVQPATQEDFPEAAFFREVLKHGHSLVIVRTAAHEITQAACSILDRLALGMERGTGAA